ncbi:hypothetical protein J2Z21_008316 [Streptomyces griseochromogenes]|uniref:Transposase n=1 Tax=Streptomyces griseochromogenes TaxID=68214 RepID=A0ABS4M6J4_9ACTN|nr:hypothetical protein [Streptomyces griseochromogenes]
MKIGHRTPARRNAVNDKRGYVRIGTVTAAALIVRLRS